MSAKDEDIKRRQLESMSTEQITARIQENQGEINTSIEYLAGRASLQEYTEQRYDELLILLQECLQFLEGVSPFPLPLEWVEKRNELIIKLMRKV